MAGDADAPVRIGVIGTSDWTERMYLSTLAGHPHAAIAAICGRNEQRAATLTQKYAIPASYGDYRAMLAEAKPDAVVVASPDDLHFPMTMAALEAGAHVLCEKPLASNAGQAEQMYRAAETAGVTTMVPFTYRWFPPFRELSRLLAEGYIGRCFDCRFQFFSGYAREGVYLWRLDATRAGGVLGDLCSHLIDLARWYVGDIGRVSAHLATMLERPPAAASAVATPANDSATLLLEFLNGAHGTVQASAVASVGRRSRLDLRVALWGDEGSIELEYSHGGSRLRGARRGDDSMSDLEIPAALWSGGSPESPFGVLREQPLGPRAWVDAIITGQPIQPGFLEGWRAQQVVDAAQLAHAEGRWVSVPAG